jgi:hypothetical protein
MSCNVYATEEGFHKWYEDIYYGIYIQCELIWKQLHLWTCSLLDNNIIGITEYLLKAVFYEKLFKKLWKSLILSCKQGHPLCEHKFAYTHSIFFASEL